MSETRSVLLVSGMSNTMMNAATAICTTSAAIQMTGPQPASLQRNRSPTSALSRPVPQRRLTYQHHATDGPYPIAVSSATYTRSGQSKRDSTSINNRPPTNDAKRMTSAPTAAVSGSDGCGAAGGASVIGAGTKNVGGAQSMSVEVARAGPSVRIRVPARRGRRGWWELCHGQGAITGGEA